MHLWRVFSAPPEHQKSVQCLFLTMPLFFLRILYGDIHHKVKFPRIITQLCRISLAGIRVDVTMLHGISLLAAEM